MIEVANRIGSEVSDSEVLADRMPREKIEVYLQIAHSTISKSVFAIFTGTLIVAFGLFLRQLLSWATEQSFTPITPISLYDSASFWIIRGFFMAVGSYLIMQGVLCLIEARVQSTIMSKALQLKQLFSRKG